MDYRDDWRRYPRDAARHNDDVDSPQRDRNNETYDYAVPQPRAADHRADYQRGSLRAEQRYDSRRGRPATSPRGRSPEPLFGSDYGEGSDRDVVGSSLEVDDYAFFNAGNYGRHYGGGYGTAQPSRSLADRNLREDWYAVPSNNPQTNRFVEDKGHRGRGPRSYTRSDERILEEVHEHLTEDRHIDASNIDVVVKDGEVTLNGTVDSRQAKRHAEDLTERVSGVLHTQNNLRVGEAKAKSGWEKEAEGVAQATAQIKRPE